MNQQPESKTILIAEATPNGGGDLTFSVNEHATPDQLAQVAAYSLGEMVGRCENPTQAFELMAKITQAPMEPAIDGEATEIPEGTIELTHTYEGPAVRESDGETERILGAFGLVVLTADTAVLDNGEGGRWSIGRDDLPRLETASVGSALN